MDLFNIWRAAVRNRTHSRGEHAFHSAFPNSQTWLIYAQRRGALLIGGRTRALAVDSFALNRYGTPPLVPRDFDFYRCGERSLDSNDRDFGE
jgi:hypothetical protein